MSSLSDIKIDYDNYDPNIFKNDIKEYRTELKPVENYIKQISTLVARELKIDKDVAVTLVRKKLKDHPTNNPLVKFVKKQENGDNAIESLPLTDYIKEAVSNDEIIVPSFTTYLHPNVKKSLHSEFLNINVKLRKEDKHNEFKYKQEGNLVLSGYYNVMQKVRKVANNSLSGAYASKSTGLNNPSAHYTLTSITRSVASIGNAVSESVVAGNKHFRNKETLMNYVLAASTGLDLAKVGMAVRKYNLYIPTPLDVLDSLLYSSNNYWIDKEYEKEILSVLQNMSETELCAVCYNNDLHHLRKYNDGFVRELLRTMSSKVPVGSDKPLQDLKIAPEGINILTNHIWMDEIRGMDLSNYNVLVEKDPELLVKLGSTTRNILLCLEKYKLLFKAFFVTDVMPISIAYIRDMLRDCIVLSDTDSTCGSYDKWVEWYFGDIKFTSEAVALSASVMTINTQTMDHHLKTFSRNMNVPIDSAELIKMKNEYTWDVFTAANVSKHYDANVLLQEGNVLKEAGEEDPFINLELKGVHYIASSVDQSIVRRGKEMILEVSKIVGSGGKISLHKYITMAADMERELIGKIKKGDSTIFKKDKIKNENSYSLGRDKSPYFHHLMWEEVFRDKYGASGEPIYMVTKVPTIMKTKNDMKTYLASLEDTEIRDKLKTCMEKYGKEYIGTFRPPAIVVADNGLPDEIIKSIDVKRIVMDNMNFIYLKLESLGFYRKSKSLISEMGY